MSPRLGLIVNPIAGLGGRVGLKGSDGPEIQARARALGVVAPVPERAVAALERLAPLRGALDLLTAPGQMGEQTARACGFEPQVMGAIDTGRTSADDTVAAAQAMQRAGVDLILFAGGDGTARDLCRAVAAGLPVLGIPAGVKVLSGAFASNPAAAGELARRFLEGATRSLREAEVLDLDEQAYRAGAVRPRLYGALTIPYLRRWVPGRKAPGPPDARGVLRALAAELVAEMQPGAAQIVGPGGSTRPILETQGLPKTLVGVDVVLDGRLLLADAGEAGLLDIAARYPARVLITPVGGQGYLLGRGNQPISPAVIRLVGPQNLVALCLPEKLHALRGRPLLVDTGEAELDRSLCGYWSVRTGPGERSIYRVST